MLSDFWPHGQIAERYGVLRSAGYSERAIFIIDRNGIIQYVDIHDIDQQPSNDILFAELARINPTYDSEIVARLNLRVNHFRMEVLSCIVRIGVRIANGQEPG